MSGTNHSHPDADALERYRRRALPPGELLACDAHIATCNRCYALVRVDDDTIDLPHSHLTYEELEAFVDGRAGELDRDIVIAHTTICELCTSELADLQSVRDSRTADLPRVLPHVRPALEK